MVRFSSPRVADLWNEATTYLKGHHVPSASLDARLLLQHVLQKPREFLVREPDHLCTSQEVQEYEQLLNRRAQREPVAKIIGMKEFWGLSFRVTQDVLDPRPDSETLIEAVRETFADPHQTYRILDFGVGSGCLLLSLLHEYPNATGVGVDISEAALEVARQNAYDLGLEQRSQFVHGSWGQGITGPFDMIISNPPYIPSQTIPTLEKEVREFDPFLALDGGGDGLDCYRSLVPDIARLLKPNGHAFLEIGQGQEKDVEAIFASYGLTLVSWKKDLQGINRCGVFVKGALKTL